MSAKRWDVWSCRHGAGMTLRTPAPHGAQGPSGHPPVAPMPLHAPWTSRQTPDLATLAPHPHPSSVSSSSAWSRRTSFPAPFSGSLAVPGHVFPGLRRDRSGVSSSRGVWFTGSGMAKRLRAAGDGYGDTGSALWEEMDAPAKEVVLPAAGSDGRGHLCSLRFSRKKTSRDRRRFASMSALKKAALVG